MENGHDDIEEDLFDDHLNDIDERETPRWEMSEEELDEDHTRLPNCTGIPTQQNSNPSKKDANIVQNGHNNWNDDADSVKDFCGPYREQEAKYTERTDEAIVIRAAEEHIRQPIPFDDVDSVKNFGGASQGISRIPSEEHLCLSPPWPPGYEVEDGVALEDPATIFDKTKITEIAPAEALNFRVDEMIAQANLQVDARIGATSWQGGETIDFTRNYAEEGSLEHSRRPSSEDISLTPPWLDTDKESSCKDPEEQEVDDKELPSADPPTTSSILTSASTTSYGSPLKPDLSTTISNKSSSNTLPENLSQNISIRTSSVQADPTSVPGNPSEPRPPQRRTPQGGPSDWNTASGLKTVLASRPPQMRPYGDVYGNKYPALHRPFSGNEPYGPVHPYMANLSYTGKNVTYGHRLPNTRMPSTEFMQQQRNVKPHPGMSYNSRQFRPNNMGFLEMPNRTPTNPSYSDMSRPYPKGYYEPIRFQLGPRVPRPSRYDAPYHGAQPGNWPPFKRPQISPQSPLMNVDFARDEVINFAADAQRSSSAPIGVPATELHRSIPQSEHQRGIASAEIHRIPASERSEFRRDMPATLDSRRGIPTRDHQRAMPERQVRPEFEDNILDMNHYTDFPDDITTVSDSDISPVMSTRSGSHSSQSSLAVYCSTPHRDGIETASVMSFTSGASTHQDLDSKIDQVRNLLAVIDTRDPKETSQTLFSLSNSKENCQAMRLTGCLSILIQLQHNSKSRDPRVGHEVRVRSAQALRNIIAAGMEDKRGKRERRVLKLIEIVRNYCVEVRYVRNVPSSSKLRALDTALAAIMKLSFEEEHRAAIEELGGVEAIGEFLDVCYVVKDGDLSLGSNVRKYASMTLTNMTFEKTSIKALLGNSHGIVKALLKNLSVFNDEDLTQVSASVLRNLSCKSDERSKLVLQECNAVSALMAAAQKVSGESTLRTILYAVWNLSAHSSQNKTQICQTHKALGFLVEMMAYKSPSNSLSVVESSGGILRNLSSQIAVNSEYRAMLREQDCCKVLLTCLRSPSLRVVGNACGILWNLSARCEQDQEILVKQGALSLLKPLVTSKNKSIAKGAGAAIKNLQNYKASNPGRDSPSEVRKQNGILRPENGSPSQARTKFGRPRDAHSLNSFTGSADDVASGRVSSRIKENGDLDSTRTKGVRWSDDKRAGKDLLRKTSSNDRKRGDSSPDEQQALINGVENSKVLGSSDAIDDVTSAVGQFYLGENSSRVEEKSPRVGEKSPRVGEKSRSKKSDGIFSSPRSRKKASSKTKKHSSGGEDLGNDTLRLSQESQLNRSMSSRQGSTNVKHSGKQMVKGEEGLRNSPKSVRNNLRISRNDSVEDNDRDFNDDKLTRSIDASMQRCQCADDTEIWVKRSKFCNQCQKRRISHSSDSTSGSRRSSYESLSSSNRQLNRKEPSATGSAGHETTL